MSLPDKKDFIFAGNWAYSNLGCEAIVRGTVNLLREAAGDCRFISHYFTEQVNSDIQREKDPAIIHRPFPYFKRYSLPWIGAQIEKRFLHRPASTQVLNSLLPSLKDAKGVFMLGGDTFSPDYGNSDVYFAISGFAASHALPVTIWGASIGPFSQNREYERWAANELRKVSLLCARETETLQYLDGLGLKDNVILTADPSFYLEPCPVELPSVIEKALVEGCIGLNLSPMMQRYLPKNDAAESDQEGFARWIAVAAQVVDQVVRQFSLPVLLIPHVFSECGDLGRDDYLFLSRVAQKVLNPDRVLVLKPGLNAGETKWVISRVRAFAGARTHTTLAAISTLVPTVCIGYSLKARGIAKDVYGNLDWLLSGGDLVKNPAALCERLTSLLDQASAIRAHLEQGNPIFRQRALAATQRFLEIVN